MKSTIFVILNRLKEALEKDGVQNLSTEKSLAFLNEFFEHIFRARDMIELIVPKNKDGYQAEDEFTLRVLDFLERTCKPNGWQVRPVLGETIDSEKFISWVKKNTDSNIPFTEILGLVKSMNEWNEKEDIENIFVYPFIMSSYKNLCAIIDEYK